jgi:hypothetical protein
MAIGYCYLRLAKSFWELIAFHFTSWATSINVCAYRKERFLMLLRLPLLSGLVSVCANFTVVSDKQVKVNFERLVAGSQTLIGYQDVNSFIDTLRSPKKLLAIDFQIKREDQKGWLETTYLDQDLRIGRGNEGNLFVLRRV